MCGIGGAEQHCKSFIHGLLHNSCAYFILDIGNSVGFFSWIMDYRIFINCLVQLGEQIKMFGMFIGLCSLMFMLNKYDM